MNKDNWNRGRQENDGTVWVTKQEWNYIETSKGGQRAPMYSGKIAVKCDANDRMFHMYGRQGSN